MISHTPQITWSPQIEHAWEGLITPELYKKFPSCGFFPSGLTLNQKILIRSNRPTIDPFEINYQFYKLALTTPTLNQHRKRVKEARLIILPLQTEKVSISYKRRNFQVFIDPSSTKTWVGFENENEAREYYETHQLLAMPVQRKIK